MTDFHSLSTLIKRLEVATSRLEDLAVNGTSANAVQSSVGGPAAAVKTDDPLVVVRYNEIINEPLKKYLDLSQRIGGLVAEQSTYVNDTILAQREIIIIATRTQKPDYGGSVFAELIKPMAASMSKVNDIRERGRGTPFQDHLAAVNEGIMLFGWISVEPTPAPFVKDMIDASELFANRIKMQYKEKDPTQVEWINAYTALLQHVHRYVKENHTTGVVWNPKGNSGDAFISANRKSATAPLAGAPPPPPPPPPPASIFGDDNDPTKTTTGTAAGAGDMNAVFAELNKGENVTAGLKKVDKSLMTHKNPALRGKEPIKEASLLKKAGPPTPTKPAQFTLKKPARTALEGNKWVVENHESNASIVISEATIGQTVYIFGCKNSTIQIKGKINAVTMDSCVKCGLAVDSVVASIDIVNSRSFGLQIFQVTPTIAIDKSDGGQIYLSRESLGVEILTAKCSALNVLVPPTEGAADDADFAEVPVPEQFKSTIVEGKVVTVPVEHTA